MRPLGVIALGFALLANPLFASVSIAEPVTVEVASAEATAW
jgi:hypothetical protein